MAAGEVPPCGTIRRLPLAADTVGIRTRGCLNIITQLFGQVRLRTHPPREGHLARPRRARGLHRGPLGAPLHSPVVLTRIPGCTRSEPPALMAAPSAAPP